MYVGGIFAVLMLVFYGIAVYQNSEKPRMLPILADFGYYGGGGVGLLILILIIVLLVRR